MDMRFVFRCFLCVLTGLAVKANAQEEKNWELGVGIASIYGPDYRGADEYRSYTAPIPYVIYHGKFLHSDREGVRTDFFSSRNLDFTLSAGAYIAPNVDKNNARSGMPSLGSTFELGPSINIRLTGEDLHHGWHLQLPWRAVFAVAGDNNGYIGSVFQPQFIYQNNYANWLLRYRVGVMFGSNAYHDYYYSVTSAYVTDDRAQYNASGGYSGFTNEISLGRAIKINDINTRIAFFIRYDNLQGVNIDASPLFKTDNLVRGGIAFIWVIK